MNIRKRFLKFLLSMIHIQGKRPSAMLERSMREDPELLRHWESEEVLTDSLRSESVDPVSVPSDLRERILAEVEPVPGEVVPFPKTNVIGWLTPAMAAILVIGSMLVVLQLKTSSPGGAGGKPVARY